MATEFRFGVPYEHNVETVKAESLEEALEIFCSTIAAPEKCVGRWTRIEDDDCPRGYNMQGHKFVEKPTMPKTAQIPDDQVIQVYVYDDELPHWNMEEPGDYRLVFELPLEDLWRYDRWQNVPHPMLPSPTDSSMPTDIAVLEPYRGKKMGDLNRSDIARIRQSIFQAREAMKDEERRLSEFIHRLDSELQFRSQQLRFLTLYLGRDIKVVPVRKGPKAPDSEKITVRQRVLYMAEEVGVIGGHAGFDFRNLDEFDEWVAEPEHLDMIAPESKCIVALKPRRRDVDYGDRLLSLFMNLENRKTYFLLRNGEMLYRVFAPVQVGTALFPEPEVFERDQQREMQRHFDYIEIGLWDWRYWKEKKQKREAWKRKLGVTDADFRYPLPFSSKQEYDAHVQKIARMKADPEAHLSPEEQRIAMYRAYEEYVKHLKDFFYGLAFIQGIFDRTDIFGRLGGKVNVFTGYGTEQHVTLVYDASPSRLLVDGDTPTLEDWLKTESSKVKVGDLVVVPGLVHQGSLGVARVSRVVNPNQIVAYTPRSWESKVGHQHRLQNDHSVTFFPFNLPIDGVQFYLGRRQDRDKYWDNLLHYLLLVKRMHEDGKTPKLSRPYHRLAQW